MSEEINGKRCTRQEFLFVGLRKDLEGKEYLKIKDRYIVEEVSRAGLGVLHRPALWVSALPCVQYWSEFMLPLQSHFNPLLAACSPVSLRFRLSSLILKSLSGVTK